MDKYEYHMRVKKIGERIQKKDYKTAAKIADSIDWRRVRDLNTLYTVAEVYEQEERYEDCMEILNIAYDRAPVGRMLLYKMTEVATKMHQFKEAIALYREFVKAAPHDQSRYILKYQIYRERGSAVTDQIQILKDYKSYEYQERWAYELASLYAEAGMEEDCVRECDELILWFSEGEYVRKAMELKQRYQPLTASQQEKYDNPGRGGISDDDFEKTEVAVDTGKYSTMDMQAELAASLDELLKSQATVDIPELSVELPEPVVRAAEEEAKTEETEIELVELGLPGLEEITLDESPSEPVYAPEPGDVPGMEAILEPEAKSGPEMMPEAKLLPEHGSEAVVELEPLPEIELEPTPVSEPEIEAVPEIEPLPESEPVPEETQEPGIEAEPETEEELAPEFEILFDLEELQDGAASISAESVSEDAEDAEQAMEPVFGPSEPLSELELQPAELLGEPDPESLEADEEETGLMEPESDELSLEDFQLEELRPGETETQSAKAEFAEPRTVESVSAEPESIEQEPIEEEVSAPEFPELELDELEIAEPGELEATDLESGEARAPEQPQEEESAPKSQTGPLSIPDVLAEWEDQKAKTEAILEAGAENAQARKERVKQETAELMKKISGSTGDIPDDVRQILDEIEAEKKESAATVVTEDDLPRDVDAAEEEEDEEAGELLEDLENSMSREKKGSVSSETASLNTIQELERSLAAQTAEKAVKAGHLTREQARLFTYFTSVSGMSKQLSGLLKGAADENKSSSSNGNLVITGPSGNGKTTLAIDVVKALQKEKRIEGRKLAKVSGRKLNSKDIYDVFSRLKGGALIIEGAGALADETLVSLSLVMEGDTGGLLVILEDSAEEIDRIFLKNKNFASKFNYTIDIPIFSNDELVNFGKSYALEAGYAFDEFGVLALYDRIGSRQTIDHNVTVAEVKDIIDAAVEHAERNTIGHMFARITGKNTDENGNLLLKEEDF